MFRASHPHESTRAVVWPCVVELNLLHFLFHIEGCHYEMGWEMQITSFESIEGASKEQKQIGLAMAAM